jgi:hypothetical protein
MSYTYCTPPMPIGVAPEYMLEAGNFPLIAGTKGANPTGTTHLRLAYATNGYRRPVLNARAIYDTTAYEATQVQKYKIGFEPKQQPNPKT